MWNGVFELDINSFENFECVIYLDYLKSPDSMEVQTQWKLKIVEFLAWKFNFW